MSILKQLSEDINQIVTEIKPSIVHIATVGERSRFNPFKYLDKYSEFYPKASGTGFIIDKNGLIMTNYHVIEDGDILAVQLDDGRTYDVDEILADPITDIALIKIEANNLKPVKLAIKNELKLGEIVIAIGHPLNYVSSVTMGVISSTSRIGNPLIYIQTDVSINPGSSGGPLIDCDGNVIGINTLGLTPDEAENIAFAIPIHIAHEVGSKLLSSGTIEHTTLGIDHAVEEYIHEDIVKLHKLKRKKGLWIISLDVDGAAYEAGIEEYDWLLSIDGESISSPEDLIYYFLRNELINKQVMLEIIKESDNSLTKIPITPKLLT